MSPALQLDALLAAALGCGALACAVAYRERARLKLWLDRANLFFLSKERVTANLAVSLFLVSFAALYLEIMLIRWMGTEVRIFAYFQNLALIACFLGFGLGCYASRRRLSALVSLLGMVALIVLVELPLAPWKRFLIMLSALLSLSPDAALWGFLSSLGNLRGETVFLLYVASVVVVAAFLFLLVIIMFPLGQWVGFYLDSAPNPVTAYSINLLGSVVGIWIFAAMAFLWLPPEFWFGLAFLLCLLIGPASRRGLVAGLVLLAVSLALLRLPQVSTVEAYWSPYQKLAVVGWGDEGYKVWVNNTGYMTIANMTPEFLAHNPGLARRYRQQSSYDLPFRFALRSDRVLILGAGAGNDAAAALRNGARLVDAVEIDPVIYSLGEQLHPEQPYGSPRVRKIIEDARAFLRHTNEKYDLVLFGLLDSHTQFSDYSNMRIDNYVYTEEALREARRLLKPEGILVVKFEVRSPWTWMGQRFYAMLERVFDRPPVVLYAPEVGLLASATIFVTSTSSALWSRAREPGLAAMIERNPPNFPLNLDDSPPPTTDDWPYLYHRSRSIPRAYLTVSLLLLGLATLLVRGVLEPGRAATWQFFFLGAGFLLLETQMISRLALYFGMTWLVNCVALTAILLVLVVANLYVQRWPPRRLGRYYALLALTLLANYFFPWQRLAYEARTVGILLSLAYAIPLLFAGIVFTETFRRCPSKSAAFGANIVGAVAGGLAQNISFIVGIKALLLVATFSYVLAGLFGLLQTPEGTTRKVSATSIAEV